MRLVDVAEMRRIEQAAHEAGHDFAAMMDLAGRSVAELALGLHLVAPQDRVLILVGPGNNGGDGLVAARYLREADVDVTLYIWKRNVKGDENFRLLKRRRRGVAVLWAENDPDFNNLRAELRQADLIMDALLGTGNTRPIADQLAALLAVVKEEQTAARQFEARPAFPPNIPRFPLIEALTLGMPPPEPVSNFPDVDDPFSSGEMLDAGMDEDDDEALWEEALAADEGPFAGVALPVLAVDCPSGLDCDTGALDPAALPAQLTITFGFPKWGHAQYPGAGTCGLLAVADIGVAPFASAAPDIELVAPARVAGWLPPRRADAHKGVFGRVLIAGGSLRYTGAVALSASAAARAGAGRVTVALPLPLHAALAGQLLEITWLPLAGPEGVHTAAGGAALIAAAGECQALLVGPGLTTVESAQAFIATLFPEDGAGGLPHSPWAGRVVVDADALNILAGWAAWPRRLPPGSILTPHAGEMARLTGQSAQAVNAARIATARRCAETWGHIVLLKGPHTVVAAPDGRVGVLPFATATLATAGSGDILAGAIVAFIAQGVPAFEAAIAGAYLHGQVGLNLLREEAIAPTAVDILAGMGKALTQMYQSVG